MDCASGVKRWFGSHDGTSLGHAIDAASPAASAGTWTRAALAPTAPSRPLRDKPILRDKPTMRRPRSDPKIV